MRGNKRKGSEEELKAMAANKQAAILPGVPDHNSKDKFQIIDKDQAYASDYYYEYDYDDEDDEPEISGVVARETLKKLQKPAKKSKVAGREIQSSSK